MSDKTLRRLIAAVIAMLLIHQVGALVFDVLGVTWGIVSSVAVAAVIFFSARMAVAGGRSSFWFLVPTLLFAVVPIVATFWNAMTAEASAFDRVARLTPFVLGFAAPMVTLLIVYIALRRRTTDP